VADVDGLWYYAWYDSYQAITNFMLTGTGYIASVAFMDVHVDGLTGFNWRLMLASTAIP
jgi:hypothetical protein